MRISQVCFISRKASLALYLKINVITILENDMAVSLKKLNLNLPWFRHCLYIFTQREMKAYVHTKTCVYIFITLSFHREKQATQIHQHHVNKLGLFSHGVTRGLDCWDHRIPSTKGHFSRSKDPTIIYKNKQ